MPYDSKAQRRMFHHLLAQGKISPSAVKEFDKASEGKKLPEVSPKKMARGGMVCPHCGYAMGSDASAFAHAVKYHRNKGK